MVTAIAPAPTEATGKSCRLQLTDGWYQITAYLDARLERMVEQLRIRVGQKLSISGAQVPSSKKKKKEIDSVDMTAVSLQLSANSVLTCPWHTKLGNQRQSARHVRRIDSNVYDDGGVVTMLDVVICKKYPMMYSETMDNGSTKIRSAKEEELIRFSVAELRSDNSQERNVSGYFRLRVCDVTTTTGRMATLLVSQASEFIHTTLKEGQAYRISHIIPYEPKVRHHPGLSLRTTRMTHWEPRTPLPDTVYPMRTITPCDKIKTLTDTDNDMVVHVLYTYDAVCTRRSSDISVWQQRLLVTDASTAICQVSIYSFSRPLLIHAGQILCLSNVRFIMHDIKYNITLIKTTDESDVTTKSSIPLFTQAMADLKNWADS
ncbi:BRCA2, oligonucleotide/oligosaccharide-binding, domain 1-domain-containing protein [Gongronella butleri]|nr:BRCA2, oligonucleotide/oligosaccharide-binding, domain 1-domain-containing protein [Gongronella butleri]